MTRKLWFDLFTNPVKSYILVFLQYPKYNRINYSRVHILIDASLHMCPSIMNGILMTIYRTNFTSTTSA